MTEGQFAALIEDACKKAHIPYYHTFDSRHSAGGWPDYVFALRSGKIIIRELKTRTGKVSPKQQVWIGLLERGGIDIAVWRPEDWPERILHELEIL